MSATMTRRAQEKPVSLVAYMAQGAGFLGFLLLLFAIAGFRG